MLIACVEIDRIFEYAPTGHATGDFPNTWLHRPGQQASDLQKRTVFNLESMNSSWNLILLLSVECFLHEVARPLEA